MLIVEYFAIVWGVLLAYYLLKGPIYRLFHNGPFPFEDRILAWLRDRQMARFLGIDPDVIRARRKMDVALDDSPQEPD